MDWTEKICIAAFQNRKNAEAAVRDLEKNGFNHKQIGIIHRDEKAIVKEKTDAIGRDHVSGAIMGAGSGAALGTVLGAAATVVFPPVGAIVVAGAVLGLATGAVTGGIVGALTGMGIPKRTAEYYQREVEAGRAIVVVMTEAGSVDALTVLHNHGGYQLDQTGKVMQPERDMTGTPMRAKSEVGATHAAASTRDPNGPPLR